MNIFLFVTANEHERTAFETKFIRKEKKYILGKMYYLGTYGCYPAAYIHIDEQGVTSPGAIPLVGQLLNELRPVAVVMVGIAFGVNETNQKIGDVLVSDKILPYDSQKLLENQTEYKETPKEVGFQLLNAFREHREWVHNLPSSDRSVVYIGAMLTGSRLINNYEYRNQLLNDFKNNKPIGCEMEAQGIYSMCRLYGVAEWIIIKGICDWGYKKDNPNKETDQKTAACAAVDYCFHVFSRAGVFDAILRKDKNHNIKKEPKRMLDRSANPKGATHTQSRASEQARKSQNELERLTGVDKADALLKEANEYLSLQKNTDALQSLLEAWEIYISETGIESSDVNRTLEKMRVTYKLLDKTQPFEQWLNSSRQSN